VKLPFHWDAILDFLRPRLVPGESIVDGTYRRGEVEVRFDGKRLHVNSDDPDVIARVHRLCDVDADVDTIERHFARDPLLGPVLERNRGIRVPGAWDPFEVAVRTIVGQQVSIAGATTIMSRIIARYGTSPHRIARGRVNPGMPAARWETIRSLARAAAENDLTPERIASTRGVGPWTSNYIGMRVFRDADAFPYNDYGVRKALGTTSDRAVLAHAERWRPWRAYATVLLWRSLL
jgi:3-methyladenine DNA glycosylase/8-oxoguanine DNA glycosylase